MPKAPAASGGRAGRPAHQATLPGVDWQRSAAWPSARDLLPRPWRSTAAASTGRGNDFEGTAQARPGHRDVRAVRPWPRCMPPGAAVRRRGCGDAASAPHRLLRSSPARAPRHGRYQAMGFCLINSIAVGRRPCAGRDMGWSAWPLSISTCTTATAPRPSSTTSHACCSPPATSRGIYPGTGAADERGRRQYPQRTLASRQRRDPFPPRVGRAPAARDRCVQARNSSSSRPGSTRTGSIPSPG
jgi:hypothetical protein